MNSTNNLEALRIRVAELCGWTAKETLSTIHGEQRVWIWGKGGGEDYLVVYGTGGLPDYCNDLNACFEMEEIVLADEDTGYAYDMALCREVKAYEVEGLCNHMRLFHATAEQRCRAFVKTMESSNDARAGIAAVEHGSPVTTYQRI